MTRRLHKILLRSYPPDFRRHFGDEMQTVFEERLARARDRGWLIAVAFVVFSCIDTVMSGWLERVGTRRVVADPARRFRLMTGLLMDVRFILRLMRRSPLVTTCAMLALGLGIGATGAIFAAVNGILLRPLPYANADSLVMVWSDNTRETNSRNPVSPADFLDLQRGTQTLAGLEALQSFLAPDVFQDGATPDAVLTSTVTAGMFSLLGREAAIGRALRPGDQHEIVLSDGFWRRRYGADRSIVGRSANLSGTPHVIAGVMGPDFVFPYRTMLGPSGFVRAQATDVWLVTPFTGRFYQNADGSISRAVRFLGLVGRLKPGVGVDAARSDLTRIATDLAANFPTSNRGWGVTVLPLLDQTVASMRPALMLLAGGVGVLLLMTCVNVANLLLARSLARQRELAVRRALGATPGRLLRLHVLESLLQSIGGGIVGAAGLYGGIRLLVALAPPDTPRLADIRADFTVFLFTLAAVTVIGLVVGLVPGIAARSTRHSALGDGGRSITSSKSRQRLRSALVVAEIALAVLLSVGGMLLMRSFASVLRVDPGFRPDGLLTFQINVPARFTTADARRAYYDELFGRLEQLPGVESAGGTTRLPLGSTNVTTTIGIEGHDLSPASLPEIEFRRASHHYLEAMGIPLISGRLFTVDDGPNAPGVCLVNRALVAKFMRGEEVVGRRVRTGSDPSAPWMTIVGVIGDVRHGSLEEIPKPELYISARQNPPNSPFIVVRATGDANGLPDAVRSAVRAIDSSTPIFDLKMMTEIRREVVAERRFTLTLVGAFCVLALVLAALGVYGAMALAVSERTAEVGVRLALGAPPAHVLWLVLRQAATLAVTGVAIGAGLAFATMPLVRSQLYGVGPTDPASFIAVALTLFASALGAAFAPARRAMRVDPIMTLRGV